MADIDDNNDYVVVSQINLNKQPIANSDLALYISYLAKGFSLDENDVIRGMGIYSTDFKYRLSHEATSDESSSESEDDELLEIIQYFFFSFSKVLPHTVTLSTNANVSWSCSVSITLSIVLWNALTPLVTPNGIRVNSQS